MSNLLLTKTPLHIECLGGPCDGQVEVIDAQKADVMIKPIEGDGPRVKYKDTGKLNANGRIIYRCAGGGGKLRFDFVERNP